MFALTAFIAALFQTALPAEPGQCFRSFRQPTGTLTVGRANSGRRIAHQVEWVVSGMLRTGARWRLRENRTPWALEPMWLNATIPLSRAPRAPVWAIMSVDGRIVQRRRAATVRQIGRAGALYVYYSSLPLNFAERRTGPMPDLGDATSVTISLEEEGGASLGSVRVPLPDWRQGRTQVDEGRQSLAEPRSRC
jgi:hypothetical protein